MIFATGRVPSTPAASLMTQAPNMGSQLRHFGRDHLEREMMECPALRDHHLDAKPSSSSLRRDQPNAHAQRRSASVRTKSAPSLTPPSAAACSWAVHLSKMYLSPTSSASK